MLKFNLCKTRPFSNKNSSLNHRKIVLGVHRFLIKWPVLCGTQTGVKGDQTGRECPRLSNTTVRTKL